jgi:hypothetical protein
LPKFVIVKSLKSERQHVFDILANYENFQNILPQYFPSIRVRSVRENIAIVEEHLRLGERELVMTAKHVTKYPESHEFFVLGGDAKGTHVVETYEKTDSGTNLTITANFKVGGKMKLDEIFGKFDTKTQYGKIIEELCKIAES